MFTWIFRRAFFAPVAFLVLSACLDTAGSGGTVRSGAPVRAVPQTIAVADRAVVVGGPRGYCIDQRGSKTGGDTAFVLLGSCASISGNPDAAVPDYSAVLTASIAKNSDGLPASEHGPVQLQRFVTTPQGRAVLARDGQAGSVKILETRLEGGAIFIYLRDSSANTTGGLNDTYWRGLFELNGRLITVSVFGLRQKPLSRSSGLSTLRAFLSRIRLETHAELVANVAGNARVSR